MAVYDVIWTSHFSAVQEGLLNRGYPLCQVVFLKRLLSSSLFSFRSVLQQVFTLWDSFRALRPFDNVKNGQLRRLNGFPANHLLLHDTALPSDLRRDVYE